MRIGLLYQLRIAAQPLHGQRQLTATMHNEISVVRRSRGSREEAEDEILEQQRNAEE